MVTEGIQREVSLCIARGHPTPNSRAGRPWGELGQVEPQRGRIGGGEQRSIGPGVDEELDVIRNTLGGNGDVREDVRPAPSIHANEPTANHRAANRMRSSSLSVTYCR